MTFPFYVYNIAYPAAGFKYRTHIRHCITEKVVCLLHSLTLYQAIS